MNYLIKHPLTNAEVTKEVAFYTVCVRVLCVYEDKE